MYVCIYIYRAGFRKRKMIRNFCEIATLWQGDSQLRIIIRNVFTFLHYIHKMCLKKGKFYLQKGRGQKKRSFCEII